MKEEKENRTEEEAGTRIGSRGTEQNTEEDKRRGTEKEGIELRKEVEGNKKEEEEN